jgi:hypothetical protein
MIERIFCLCSAELVVGGDVNSARAVQSVADFASQVSTSWEITSSRAAIAERFRLSHGI